MPSHCLLTVLGHMAMGQNGGGGGRVGKALPVHFEFLMVSGTVLTLGGHCWMKSPVIQKL